MISNATLHKRQAINVNAINDLKPHHVHAVVMYVKLKFITV